MIDDDYPVKAEVLVCHVMTLMSSDPCLCHLKTLASCLGCCCVEMCVRGHGKCVMCVPTAGRTNLNDWVGRAVVSF